MQDRFSWLALGSLGALFIALASASAMPGVEIFVSKPGWLIWVFGVALLLLASCGRAGHRDFGILACALVLGSAGELALTEPLFFPAISPERAKDVFGAGMIFVVFQACIVVWALRSSIVALLSAAHSYGLGKLAILIALMGLLSASVMEYTPYGYWGGFAKQVVFGSAVVVLQMLNIVALARADAPQWLRATPRLTVMVATPILASGLLAWLAMEFVPHVEDELAYLFHARLFAAGTLWAPAPPPSLAPGIEYYLLTISDGRWFAVTTPGWPAVLTIGTFLGQPWLLNPLLAGFAVWIAYDIFRRLCDTKTAAIASMLLAGSSWFLSSAATLMPHTASTLFGVLAWWLLVRADRRIHMALLAGAAMGAVFTIRQLEGLIIGGLTGLALLLIAHRLRWHSGVFAYGIGCVAIGSLYLAYNAAMTGSPTTPAMLPYLDDLWHAGANAYGFGPDIGPTERWGAMDYAAGHSLTEGLIGALHNLFYTNFEFLGWSIGSLILIFVHILWGQASRLDVFAYVIIAVTVLAHLGYWFTGSFYIGPRYWSGILVALSFLSARGLLTLADRWSFDRVMPVLWVLMMTSLLVFLPWRGAEKYHGYGNYSGDLARAASSGEFGNKAVLYLGDGNPGEALFLNHPHLPANRPLFLTASETPNAQALGRAFAYWPESQ